MIPHSLSTAIYKVLIILPPSFQKIFFQLNCMCYFSSIQRVFFKILFEGLLAIIQLQSPMSDIQVKQQFLRVQILEAGIDPGEFLAFLVAANSKKGENLELWKIQELQEVVKAFKISKNIPLKPNQTNGTVAVEVAKQVPANTLDDSLYIQPIKCLSKEPNKLWKMSDIKIKISKFEKNDGGAFERSYILYVIQIPALNSTVARRYSDFVWLRDTLALLYPGYPIPPIKKKGNFKRYDDKYLIKKMLILQKFLNTLLSIPQVLSEQLLERFLTIPNQKQFEKMKSQYNKLEKLTLNKIKTLNGFINVGTEKKMSTRVCKYQEYLRLTQPEVKKIYKNFKGVATCFEQANEYFQSISNNCKFLLGKEQAIRVELDLPSIAENSPLSILQNLTKLYGVQLQQQARSFRKDIYSLMKYESLSRINVLEYMDELAIKQQDYNQAKMNLNKKKEKLYAEGKVEKWGLELKPTGKLTKEEAMLVMLPKQTKEVMALRQNYALYNCQIYQECLRHTKDINKMLSNYIREFIEMQVVNSSKTTEIFAEISKRSQQIQNFYLSALMS